MSNLSRRALLRVVAGTAVAAPLVAEAYPHPTAFPLTHDCDLELLELRRAIDGFQAAVRYEMSIPEDTPAHIAAVRESEAREAICQSTPASRTACAMSPSEPSASGSFSSAGTESA